MPPFLHLVPLPKSLTSDLPKPVAAGIGLAVSLPGIAFQTALALPSTVLGTTAKIVGRYEELAEIGASVVTGRRRDGLEDDDDLEFPTVEGWGDSTYEVERRLRAVEAEEEVLEPTVDEEEDPEEADDFEAELGVPDDLVRAAEDREVEPASVPDRRNLPVDDYDSLSAAALRSKVGALTAAELEELRDYEQAHAKRLTVLQLLERTIAKKA